MSESTYCPVFSFRAHRWLSRPHGIIFDIFSVAIRHLSVPNTRIVKSVEYLVSII